MSTLSLRPHVEKPGRNGEMVMVRSQPYTRLNAGEGPPVFIQAGQFFSEGGPVLKPDEVPDWLDEEIARMTPGARQEVGLKP